MGKVQLVSNTEMGNYVVYMEMGNFVSKYKRKEKKDSGCYNFILLVHWRNTNEIVLYLYYIIIIIYTPRVRLFLI